MSILEIDSIHTANQSLYDRLYSENYSACREEDGTWGIFRYNEVLHILKHPELFSANGLKRVMAPTWLDKSCQRSELISMQDPPLYNKNQKKINKLFIKSYTDALIPMMRKEAQKLAIAFPKMDNVDFMQHFSYPYVSFILNQFLKTDFDFKEIRKWIYAIENITICEPKNKDAIESAISNQRHIFNSLIEKRRMHQSNDFISKLIIESGDNLSNDDLLNIAELIVSAGFHTTIHMLSQIILLFIENSDLKEQLKNSPNKIPSFVDEALRLRPAVQVIIRTTTQNVTMPGGYTIPQNTNINAMVAAANRDPEIFKNPTEFDINRSNTTDHLTFGRSAHMCLGSALAKSELCIATEAIVQHFGNFQLSHESDRVKIFTLLGFTDLFINVG